MTIGWGGKGAESERNVRNVRNQILPAPLKNQIRRVSQ